MFYVEKVLLFWGPTKIIQASRAEGGPQRRGAPQMLPVLGDSMGCSCEWDAGADLVAFPPSSRPPPWAHDFADDIPVEAHPHWNFVLETANVSLKKIKSSKIKQESFNWVP